MPKATNRDILTVTPMGVFLVIPDHDVLPGAVVIDGSTTLRTAGLRDTPASGASRGWRIQPSQDWTSRGVILPPGRLSGWTRGHTLPELFGVLTVGGGLKEGHGRHRK